MEQGSLLRAVRRFWLLELLIVVALLALVAVPAALAADRYRATTTVSIGPSAAPGESLGSTDLIEFEMPAVQRELEGAQFAATVRSALRLPAERRWSATGAIQPGSGVLRISVSSADRDLVRPVADAYARQLATSVPERRAVSVVALDRAGSVAQIAPKPVRGIVLGLALGLVVAITTALLIDPLTRDRPRTRRGRPARHGSLGRVDESAGVA